MGWLLSPVRVDATRWGVRDVEALGEAGEAGDGGEV